MGKKITRRELEGNLLLNIMQISGDMIINNNSTICNNTNSVNIGIEKFDKTTDLLLVFRNGKYVEINEEYGISSDSTTLVPLGISFVIGDTFSFISIENSRDKTPFNYYKHTTVCDNISQVNINIENFNKDIDLLLVFRNNNLLLDSYSIATDSLSISNTSETPWVVGDKFYFLVIDKAIQVQGLVNSQLLGKVIDIDKFNETLRNIINNKVSKQDGMGLSELDYTTADMDLVHTIPSLETQLNGKVDSILNKVLTSNDFTLDYKNMISEIEDTLTELNDKLGIADFTNSFNYGVDEGTGDGWIRYNNGFTIQLGYSSHVKSTANGQQVQGTITFPITFEHCALKVVGCDGTGVEGIPYGFYYLTSQGCTWLTAKSMTINGNWYAPVYIALGF